MAIHINAVAMLTGVLKTLLFLSRHLAVNHFFSLLMWCGNKYAWKTYLWIFVKMIVWKSVCIQHLVNTQFRAGMGWMCILVLSERSADIYLIHSECNYGAFDYLGLGRFRWAHWLTVLNSLVDWAQTGEPTCSYACQHHVLTRKGQTVWLPNTPHDAHEWRALKWLVPLASWVRAWGVGRTAAA